jgi:glycosyltransferase involved in cell wall biosynthesis
MIQNKAYYLLKPIIPWRLRVALRRMRANARRRKFADVWPIDEQSGSVPPNWPGWPEGKKFAFVLSHDVEGNKGVSRVEQLMNVERKHGFRSSFNFVPEGEYRVSDELRDTLDQNGFEVGIHGLEHDGKLYSSKRSFAAKAASIRQYLHKWKACGFRSPLMQHKLSWIHELGAEYDSSTFDTDPFEPEPDGVGTIFPFWVPSPGGTGYVELPYTLSQDFTLFVVFRERDINIWKRKLDWVAERGGMVFLNTHPDYMCFDEKGKDRDEFPISYYEELLTYVREKYGDTFWQPLPREVSRYYCTSLPVAERNTRRKICMVAYTGYESDNRVRRYAETLAKRGDRVDVIAYAAGTVKLGVEEIAGVTVHRIQRRDTNERHMATYAWRLLRFLYVSSVFLKRRHDRIGYDVVHVHNMPDFLAFAAWYPKWTGAKVILDIHDIVPELFLNKFKIQPNSLLVKGLLGIEKVSVSFVDQVIVSNHIWSEKLISRSIPREKCSVFLNNVDQSIFYQRSKAGNGDKFVVLFPGSFQWHQGLDIAVQAFAILKDRAPNAEFHIYGGGPMEADLVALVKRLGLTESVKFCGGASLEGIADIIANADMGVVPKRADSFGNEAYSTKIMEFMSQGVPVVVSRTKIDTFYFDDSSVQFFTSGDPKAMADAMLTVMNDNARRAELIENGYRYTERHGWQSRKADYLELIDTLSTEIFDEQIQTVGASAAKPIKPVHDADKIV